MPHGTLVSRGIFSGTCACARGDLLHRSHFEALVDDILRGLDHLSCGRRNSTHHRAAEGERPPGAFEVTLVSSKAAKVACWTHAEA